MPDLKDPRFTLLHDPTPLRRMTRLEQAIDRPLLYVKRDDHMEIGMGGNKLRSLEFWLGAAMAQDADVLLVAGGPMSNQCRLTAAAAAVAGLDCIVFHNAGRHAQSEQASFLNGLFGAKVRFLGPIDETRRGVLVSEAAAQLRKEGRKPYIVGDAIVGALGYVQAATELHRQSRTLDKPIRHVALPGSMGPTEAGFIFGNALQDEPFEIHLVSVEYGQAELAARIARIYRDLAAHTGFAVPELDDLSIHYHMDYLGTGYGEPTERSENAILTLARLEGILLEHVYTAKTFAGFMDLAARGVIPRGEGACVIHTGGTASLFSQFHMFRSGNETAPVAATPQG